ncbi:MAG: hypothetical protein EPO13_07585 [Actinomycetota bacterium]|nr:MAG: hypothetical protein EPO13_07585 [Actinomycetota bacterium]
MTPPAGIEQATDHRVRDRLIEVGRGVLRDNSSGLRAIVGEQVVGVDRIEIAHRRLVARHRPEWTWPNDEPDAVGVLVAHHRPTATFVRLVGWWTPTVTSALALDLAAAAVWDRHRRVELDDDEAIAALLQ